MRGWSRANESPREPTFAAHLREFYADDLKRFAGVWAGGDAARLSKGPAERAILDALADPVLVRGALERLTPFERAALGLVKVHGPVMASDALALELYVLGRPLPRFASSIRAYGYQDHQAPLNALLARGLVMLRRGRWDRQYAAVITGYSSPPYVFSDPAVLAEVEPVPPQPLEISPARDVASSASKRDGEVLQRLVAVEHAISTLGVELTSRGRITKPSAARFTKRLGFEQTGGTAPTELASPTSFFLQLWVASGLLSDEKQRLDLRPTAAATALVDLPYPDQADAWVKAYCNMTGWAEYKPPGRYVDDESAEPGDLNAMRGALVTALAALPDPAAWYAIDDLSGALFERLGGQFSIAGRSRFYARSGATPEEARQERAEWLERARKEWAGREAVWIARALAGPLLHLGLVELGFGGGQRDTPRLFRLTEAGRRGVWDPFRPTMASREVRDRSDEPCWVVQPNFDVVVYLDAASPRRIRFLERVAERLPADGATATYRLTRASVYGALESGVDLDEVVATLEGASRVSLPDNVARSIADWAGRRERLTVRRDASLVEFPDAAALEAALRSGTVKGARVGDRFFLLEPGARAPRHGRQIDYRHGERPCATVGEDGLVMVDPALADLTIRDQLARWCEPTGDPNRWRLTRESVRRAVASGRMPDAILEALGRRSTRPLPAIVRVAVTAWGGHERGAVEIANAVVLAVADRFVAEAIATSETLGAFVERRLGTDAFLVKPDEAARLRAKLEEFGLTTGGDAGARTKKRGQKP